MTQPRRQRITFDDVGDVTVVRFVDRKILDEPNIQAIGDDLFKLVDEVYKQSKFRYVRYDKRQPKPDKPQE